MWIPKPKEIEAVLKPDGAARFAHFIKRVADMEAVWGLWDGGWVTVSDNEGSLAMPLWPAREYAELCREAEWAASEARSINTDTLRRDLLPKLAAEGVQIAVFPTPGGKGVIVAVERLTGALEEELALYE